MSLMIFQNLEQWKNAYAEVAKRLEGYTAGTELAAENAPQHFPCLAAFLPVGDSNVACCYVYPSAAQQLLEIASGMQQPVSHAAAYDDRPSAEDWRRQINAVLMAMISELVDVGALNEERLERAVAVSLSRLDHWIADRDARCAAKENPDCSNLIMNLMYPQEPSSDAPSD
jgi:hypothetical protein